MIFGKQQETAIREFTEWYKRYKKFPKTTKQVFRIYGYAGTGKTTLAMHFAQMIDGVVLFGAYTGKASIVLMKKGATPASTLHSLIYVPEVNDKTGEVKFKKNRESKLAKAKLLIVDECSMVNEILRKDIESFGVPILVLGDPGQLSPPEGCGAFTNDKPDIMLDEIHRQAQDNPIIWMSMKVRDGIDLDYGTYGSSRIISKADVDDLLAAEQVLVGLNRTRIDLTSSYRSYLGLEGWQPKVGERLVSLANDKMNTGILNGEMFKVNKIDPLVGQQQFLKMTASSLDRPELENLKLRTHLYLFNQEVSKPLDWKFLKGSQELFFGYAITTHRAQGSQYRNPFIVDESRAFRGEWMKWLYTAITRATDDFTLYRKK